MAEVRKLEGLLRKQREELAEDEASAVPDRASDGKRRQSLERELAQCRAALQARERQQKEHDGESPIRAQEIILENTARELALLNAEEQELAARLPALTAQIATKESRIESTVQQAQQAIGRAKGLHDECELAKITARNARGTSLSEEKAVALKAVEKMLRSAQKEQASLVTQRDNVQAQELLALESLRTEQEQVEKRLQMIPQERTHLERAREAAVRELGTEIEKDLQVSILFDDISISLLQRQLDEANAARLAKLRSASESLADWPQLQRGFAVQLPYNLPMLEVLEAALAYIDTLINSGPALPSTLDVPALAPVYGDFTRWLEVPLKEIFGYESVRGNPSWLRSRRQKLAEIIQQLKQRRAPVGTMVSSVSETLTGFVPEGYEHHIPKVRKV